MRKKVFIVCTGLGVIQRGYESFAQECFDALKGNSKFDFYLYKGKGKTGEGEKAIFNLKRDSWIAKLLAKIFGQSSYYFEQLSYFLFFIPDLLFKKPDIIIVSDFYLSCWLFHLKKKLGLKYKILFSNGAPNGPPFHFADKVQQLSRFQFEVAVSGGEDKEKHFIVPYGFQMPSTLRSLSEEEKSMSRKELNLPINRVIIVSVGAINAEHKRMDYLISEFSKLKVENKFLLILGQINEDSEAVIRLANKLLKPEEYLIKTVKYDEIHKYYAVSDIFVLASLFEGFGRVLLEAGMHGLYIIVHNHEMFKEILGETGAFGDLRKENELNRMLFLAINEFNSNESKERKFKYLYDRFSWESLKGKYFQMLSETAKD